MYGSTWRAVWLERLLGREHGFVRASKPAKRVPMVCDPAHFDGKASQNYQNAIAEVTP